MTTNKNFGAFGLIKPLLSALHDEKYDQPTPIQFQAIPHLLEGRDLLGIAQTGTGKTAAFGLPTLHQIATKRQKLQTKTTKALILVPTRELAVQIGQALKVYGSHLSLRHAVVYGGVGQKLQVDTIHHGVDILTATPGRLLDLINQRHLRLVGVSHFILDEADRMLDMGFIHDVKKIVAVLPEKCQTIFFSATMPNAVASLAGDILRDPIHVKVIPQATPVELINQSVFFVRAADKKHTLTKILNNPKFDRVIVFTRTKYRANRVALHLDKSGISADVIHGNKTQAARQKALKSFCAGRTHVLVATDIAARGIDIDNVSHVINYELPNVAEDYIHRIGRTGRAGASGSAISFCDPSEQAYLRDIEKLIKLQLSVAGGEPAQQEPANANKRHKSGRKPQASGRKLNGQKTKVSGSKGSKPSGRRSRNNKFRGPKKSLTTGAK